MINVLQAFDTLIGTVHASERQYSPPIDLSFTFSFSVLAVYLKVLILQ